MIFPRYLKPEYLAVYVSLFAIILSQFPPIYQIFAKSKPKVVLDRYVNIGHNLGRTLLFVPITISNTGARSLVVAKVECVLVAEEAGSSWKAPAQSYIDKQSISPNAPAVELPIGQLLVKENQIWQEGVLCFKLPDSRQNRAMQLIFSKTTEFLSNAFANRSSTDQSLVKLPVSIIDEAIQEFEQNFDLKSGPYKLSVRLLSAEDAVLAQHSARLTLDQPDIDRLRNMRKHYRYGYGIGIPMPNNFDKLYKTLDFF